MEGNEGRRGVKREGRGGQERKGGEKWRERDLIRRGKKYVGTNLYRILAMYTQIAVMKLLV